MTCVQFLLFNWISDKKMGKINNNDDEKVNNKRRKKSKFQINKKTLPLKLTLFLYYGGKSR